MKRGSKLNPASKIMVYPVPVCDQLVHCCQVAGQPCPTVTTAKKTKECSGSAGTHLQRPIIRQVRAVQGIPHSVFPKACSQAVGPQLPCHFLQSGFTYSMTYVCTCHCTYSKAGTKISMNFNLNLHP